MITNIRIELTDEQRVRLQEQLTGKRSPITRAQLSEFVDGILEGATRSEALATGAGGKAAMQPNPDLTQIPNAYRAQFEHKSESWKQGWLKGWNLVGQSLK